MTMICKKHIEFKQPDFLQDLSQSFPTRLIFRNSEIHSETFSQDFFLSLGVSGKNLSHLALHNSSLENVTFWSDLDNLRTLDLRNNHFVDVFTEIRLISLEEIFLSGNIVVILVDNILS